MPEQSAAQRPSAWLVIGGLHLINGTTPRRPHDPLIVLAVPPIETVRPSSTIVAHWARLGPLRGMALRADGGTLGPVTADGASLFPAGALSPALAAGMDATMVPLCYLSAAAGGGYHVYGQVRFLAEDGCFVRITEHPVGDGPVMELRWLAPALDAHASHALFLNNHQRYYQKCFPGRELEYKYTLDPPPDIWALTVELHQIIRRGELAGYIPEYRDEFQAWDYTNHLFDVVGPGESARGYASFIPTTDGRHLLKRKWYVEDGFDRREQHTYGLEVSAGQFGHYLRTELGVEAIPLPPFRRVRYDVNFESVRTGHVYGIFFDHCSLLDAPDVVLSQCELEYLRTRSPLPADEGAALAEMAELADWLEGYLRGHGQSGQRSYYSKRTFLRDAVRREPRLAVPAQ